MKTELRRILGLLLAAAVLCLALSACGLSPDVLGELLYGSPEPAPEPTRDWQAEGIQPLTEGGWLYGGYRTDTDFEDMAALAAGADMGPLLEELLEFENGGDEGDFGYTYFLCSDELARFYALYTLADIAYCSGPSDAAAQDLEDARLAWEEAYADFCDAMVQIASTADGAALIDGCLGEGAAELHYSMGSEPDAGEAGCSAHEASLLHEYNLIMQEPQPDLEAAAEIYVELVELRNARARDAGWQSFADMEYSETYYRSYTPADTASVIWPEVKAWCAPLLSEYEAEAARRLERLYSSGLDCSEEAVLSALEYVALRLCPDALEAYDYMLEHGLCDLSYDPGKLGTGFTSYIYYFNEPYLFNSPYGDADDFGDSFHEFGHFLNAYGTTSDLVYGMPDYDLSELQSQGMEVMATHWYEELFGDLSGDMLMTTLWDLLASVVDGALYDEFQQRCYAEPGLTAERACEIYLETAADYGREPGEAGRYDWVYILHNFEYPFYYISYCVSALPALELYGLLLEDPAEAAELYMHAASLDTELYYFDEALAECGFTDVFEPGACEGCAQQLRAVFASLCA